MKYYLALGSNLVNRLDNLVKAEKELERIGRIKRKSVVYESQALGPVKQGPFLNSMVFFESGLRPWRLLGKIKKIELKIGRQSEPKWGPRIIDIDIIDWEGPVIDTPLLSVPHKLMTLRSFVLIPLGDVKPDYTERKGNTIANLIEKSGGQSALKKYGNQW